MAAMRRSRQSNAAFTNIDIDAIGNIGHYEHLTAVKNNSKGDLAHMINLRNYKNTTKFKGQEPFQWPPPKTYEPKAVYAEEVDILASRLKNNKSNWHMKDYSTTRNYKSPKKKGK